MQAELNLSCWGTHAGDLPKTAIVEVVIRVAVAGNIENVEEVGSETYHLLAPNVKVLE